MGLYILIATAIGLTVCVIAWSLSKLANAQFNKKRDHLVSLVNHSVCPDVRKVAGCLLRQLDGEPSELHKLAIAQYTLAVQLCTLHQLSDLLLEQKGY